LLEHEWLPWHIDIIVRKQQRGIQKTKWKVEKGVGGEYVGEGIGKVCNDNDIEQQFYCTIYTLQQNGISENMNRILTEHSSCSLNDALMNKRFWSLAMCHGCWVRNWIFAIALKSSDGKQRSPWGMLKVFWIVGDSIIYINQINLNQEHLKMFMLVSLQLIKLG